MSGLVEGDGRKKKKCDRRVSQSVEELLSDISDRLQRRYSVDSDTSTGGRGSAGYSSLDQHRGRSVRFSHGGFLSRQLLQKKSTSDLEALRKSLIVEVKATSNLLVHHLKVRDKHSRKRLLKYDLITAYLQAMSPKRSVDTQMRFSIYPFPGEKSFSHWCSAIKMATRIRGGIPLEFRRAMWLSLANHHIETRKIDWEKTKWSCLNDRSNPDDDKLGAQIVKDLHRTGCSLFTGKEKEHNQALLKMVLLAYARWNTQVGYCQGFNMLAAILLEVMQWKEDNALKVMIYLIEGVLPQGYFALHMRDLSVDMAVFRDLLKNKLPVLSGHLTKLQMQAQDTVAGTSYEPPLINVFTMQWFLTLFSNCLPKSMVLRVWDLILLEGNDVLLKTALTIWGGLAKRVMTVASADEFYSIMGALTREMLEFGIMETNDLIQAICNEQPSTAEELHGMRDKYAYNIRPLSTPFLSAQTRSSSPGNKKRSMRLCFSDDEEDMDDIAMATWCTLATDNHLQRKYKEGNH